MAGAVGFEPTVHDTKNRCLTTWPRPNIHINRTVALLRRLHTYLMALLQQKILCFFLYQRAMAVKHLS